MTTFSEVVDAFEEADKRKAQTLKEILLDASRYRHLREHMVDFIESWDYEDSPSSIDCNVDAQIAAYNE